MSKQKLPEANLDSLIGMLAAKDGATRQKARKSLVALGKPGVSSLTRLLLNSRTSHVRWEVVKTLNAIGDSRVIPSLVKALEDSDIDVGWLAAEGLRKFKKEAWPALLRALVKSRADSVSLRRGAHHVFRNQKEKGFNDLLAALTDALESNTLVVAIPIAASGILERMKAMP